MSECTTADTDGGHQSDIGSELVRFVRLRRPLPLMLHAYMAPFFALHAVWLLVWLSSAAAVEMLTIGSAVLVVLQVLTALSCLWSVRVRCALTTRAAGRVQEAVLAHVEPTENNGCGELLPLFRQPSRDQSQQLVVGFRFQKAKFLWQPDKKRFAPLLFPVCRRRGDYVAWRGHASDEDVQHAERTFGTNVLDLDVPDFWELFIERAAAPFFVFQVFCVGLWCLDEYWYFSLFTLFMLVMFECTLVLQQMRNLSDVRRMDNAAFRVHVLRCRKWRLLDTSQLLPGDLVSVTRSERHAVPCDLLLLYGSCIVDESMLTGESVPQMKEPLPAVDDLDVPLDLASAGRLHVLYGGTRVVQHTAADKTADNVRAADSGCVAYVLRTGFATSQGSLLRTIMFSVKRVTANNRETFGFIMFLLVFAMAAAGYLWTEGVKNPARSRYKLFLECTLILTSVIPPELPIELSLAVNSSLVSLARLLVFCTEPFRIPAAGKVHVCCFDKTGTLTTNNLIVEGVSAVDSICPTDGGSGDEDASCSHRVVAVKQAPAATLQVLATCHSLAHLDGGLVGDPLEKALLASAEWTLTKGDGVVPPRSSSLPAMKILQRFHFSSSLKRMSVLVGYTPAGSGDTHCLTTVKGAPETVKTMLQHVPDGYDATYLRLARRGARVLALAIRQLGVLSSQQIRQLRRPELECQLTFAGFAVISCPLKPDSRAVITELLGSSHQVTMITGDNALTACHVASQLSFTAAHKTTSILTHDGVNDEWQWRSVDETSSVPLEPASWREFFAAHNLCVTGEALTFLQQRRPHLLPLLVPRTRVFARVAPKQKEFVVTTLKRCGYTTLMCGDGTNDVGALKHAHVGVAILASGGSRRPAKRSPAASSDSGKDKSSSSSSSSVVATTAEEPSSALLRRNAARRTAVAKTPAATTAAAAPAVDVRQQRLQQLNKMMRQLEEDEEARVVKPGDASIAAPFTCKHSSIESVCQIIKQGRCTLVTTLQMFKILALNALILAYSQSVLYLDGVKFSDGQATLQGVLLAFSFLFISRSRPLSVLSRQRPLPNIFNAYTVLTVTAQFAVHLSCLVMLVAESKSLMPLPTHPAAITNATTATVNATTAAMNATTTAAASADGADEPPMVHFADVDGEFEPNVLNSAVYMISMTLQVATFAINYRGRPFMQSLAENRPLLYSIVGALTVVATLASGALPALNEQFSVVEFPDEFRSLLLRTLSLDVCAAFVADRLLRVLLDRTALPAQLGD